MPGIVAPPCAEARLAGLRWVAELSWLVGLRWVAELPWPAGLRWVAELPWLADSFWPPRPPWLACLFRLTTPPRPNEPAWPPVPLIFAVPASCPLDATGSCAAGT